MFVKNGRITDDENAKLKFRILEAGPKQAKQIFRFTCNQNVESWPTSRVRIKKIVLKVFSHNME